MNKTVEYGIIFTLMIVVLLIIFIYIHVFTINKDTKHVALEHIGIESYLVQGQTKGELIKTYVSPHSEPYFNIAVSYPSGTAPNGLEFQVFNDKNNEVSYRTVITKESSDYKQYRIYFDNTDSSYYTVNYTLPVHANNLDTVEIVFTELRV